MSVYLTNLTNIDWLKRKAFDDALETCQKYYLRYKYHAINIWQAAFCEWLKLRKSEHLDTAWIDSPRPVLSWFFLQTMFHLCPLAKLVSLLCSSEYKEFWFLYIRWKISFHVEFFHWGEVRFQVLECWKLSAYRQPLSHKMANKDGYFPWEARTYYRYELHTKI